MTKAGCRKLNLKDASFAAISKLACLSKLRFARSRRAVSVVISNIIMIAAVISIGFVVLMYANSQSNDYVSKYGSTVSSDIDKLSENVAFEFAYYSPSAYSSANGSLAVYFMNVGSINNVNFTSAKISNSSWTQEFLSLSNVQIRFLNGSLTSDIDVHQEGYITLALSQTENNRLKTGTSYTIKLTTWRGSIFAYEFTA